MEFLSSEPQQQMDEELPLPSPDYYQTGYRLPGPASRGPPQPPPRPQGRPVGAPNLQFFGPKDFVPEVAHLVARDYNGLQMAGPSSQPRIDEEFAFESLAPAKSAEYLQLVPKPRLVVKILGKLN